MKKYEKVIFVCTDNTCRSIMAEAVMSGINKRQQIEVTSRGLIVLFSEPINPKAEALLASAGLMPSRKYTMPLTEKDFIGETVVLTLTEHEAKLARERFPGHEDIYSIGAFTEHPSETPELRTGELSDYGAMFEHIDFMVKLAAEILFA